MLEKLRQLMSLPENNFDCVLIVSPENRRYFTDFPSSDGYLIVGKEKAVFITDSRYFEAAKNKATSCEVILQSRSMTQIADIISDMGAKSVALEAGRTTLLEYSRLCEYLSDFEIISDSRLDEIISSLRSVKSFTEVESIKSAQKIAESAFEHVLGFIKTGVTEKEIALELDYFMLKNGAEALSFDTIAICGKNTSMPHGVPSDARVENGHFVTMDFGAVVNGYHSDMTRTVAVGAVSDMQKNVYSTVLNAQEAALEFIRAGVSCFDADKTARDVIAAAGYGEFFGHSLGHSVGIEIHELPNLSPASKNTLRAGNVVTVEPGIYLPSKFGVRIEDMVLVADGGSINLTHADKQLVIL